MIPDWEVTLDSDNLADPSPEDRRRSRRRRRWFWLAAAIMLALLMVGAVILSRQRAAGRAALREDLTALVFEEETARFLGPPEQATALVLPTAPPRWRQAYRQTFQTDGLPPDVIHMEKIDTFDGQCATVTMSLDGYQAVRRYCLSRQQWRRAPIPDDYWDREQTVIDLPNQVRLSFLPRDQVFATALADDLPHLLEEAEQLAGRLGRPASLQAIEIVIEPHELHPPLIQMDGDRIVLNSPGLVPFPGDGTPSGQAAVRLALAKALLRRAGLAEPEPRSSLPGASRFIVAAQTVIAAELALPPETRTALSDTWQARLRKGWVSPFFADLLAPDKADSLLQARWSAYLTAEYIYRLEGLDTLAGILQELPAADSWDPLFQTRFNRSTVALEQEVAAFVRGSEPGSAFSAQSELGLAPADLPLQTTLLKLEELEPTNLRASVEPPAPAGPVWVEIPPNLPFQTPAGDSLPSGCLVPGAALEIEGRWLEAERRLQASRVTVSQVIPLTIQPAPADTIAFLVEGEPPAEPDVAAAHIFPSNRSFFIADELLWPQALVALGQDGTIQPLTPLSSTLRMVPLPVASGGTAHFLFILDLPGCERSWFVHYDPQQGIIGQWLGLPPPMKWVWRADRQDLMFFNSRTDGPGHRIYGTDDRLSPQPVSQTGTPVSFAGWNVKREQLVFIRRAWVGATGIGLLDPDSGAMQRAKVYVYPLRARRLSPNGDWMAYLTGTRNRFDPPYRLELLGLENLAEISLIELDQGQGLGPAVWSPYLADSRLAALAGPLAEDGSLRPTRLLVARPDRPGSFRLVAEANAGEQLASPVFCADGSLLYRAAQDGRYHLKRQQPGLPADLLFSSDRPFRPVACP